MIGSLLYETADIAFDTSTGRFTNPKTGSDLGPTPPAGGWPISWYSQGGNVVVPVGAGAVSQTEADAVALRAKVTSQLATQAAVQGSQSTTVNNQQSGGSSATSGSSTPGTVASTQTTNVTNPPSVSLPSMQTILSKIPDFPNLDFLGVKWYVWGAGAVAAFMMMRGSGGSGGRRGRY